MVGALLFLDLISKAPIMTAADNNFMIKTVCQSDVNPEKILFGGKSSTEKNEKAKKKNLSCMHNCPSCDE